MADRSHLSHRIYRRHLALVRELRDMYIFLQQATPALEAAKAMHIPDDKRGGKDKRYFVPVAGRTKHAQRKDADLIAIYDYYLKYGLYKTFLVTGVSEFEVFLADVLTFVFEQYPGGISRKYPGIQATTSVDIETVVNRDSQEDIVTEAIRKHVQGVFYAKPSTYINYVCEIVGANRNEDAFAEYIEIKATRDLLVHGDAKVSTVYLAKSGERARATLGDVLDVDEEYFGHFVKTATRISGVIERDSKSKFPNSDIETE